MIKIGDTYKTTNFGLLKVIGYNSWSDVTVEFIDTGFVTNAAANHIMNGMVKDLLKPNVLGVGFVGNGVHSPVVDGVMSKSYITWHGMMQRCYSTLYQNKRPTYKGCSVEKEWHNFQNFADWFANNYVEGYHLDKDLLVIGNKVYSSDTCVFVPSYINTFIMSKGASRGEYPIGVCFNTITGKYSARCQGGAGKRVSLGNFCNKNSAYGAWLKYKLGRALELKEEMDNMDMRIYPNVVSIINSFNVIV